MKYVKPNGMVLDIHERSIEYVETLGWKPFVDEPVVSDEEALATLKASEEALVEPKKKVAKKKVSKKKTTRKKK
jgi:hypothetical protein